MKPIFTIFLILSTLSSHADVIDQKQLAYIYPNDLHSDGASGQTFTAGSDGYLKGISLLAQGAKWMGDHPYGSDFTITLREMANGSPSSIILAEGTVSKDEIELNTLNWITVIFDTPYQQSSGELLSFTINELSGGGSEGWNEYAMSDLNPYPGGQQFYTYSEGTSLTTSNYDMAFQTITVPEPSSALLLLVGAGGITYYRRQKTRTSQLRPS